jgi:2,3-bisphosphoglycerate-independent phosphoglycerate mutase
LPDLKRPPLALVILDGFGSSTRTEGNAIKLARTPHFDRWFRDYSNTLIEGSGKAVGLPVGQMGNSEVGHLNIGAGRIVRMDISRIDAAIEDGDFYKNPALLAAMDAAERNGSAVHLMGLVSHGGVHSWHKHLYALLSMAAQHHVEHVFVHAFLDGRDTPPESGAMFVRELVEETKKFGVGQVASIIGRYYAMDRDKRWERVEKAYRLLVCGEGRPSIDPVKAIEEYYLEGITDEFMKPIVITNPDGAPVATVRNGDSVVFFNFRADRARELTVAFTQPDFQAFKRERLDIRFTCMTQYDKNLPLPVAFGPVHHEMILADVMAQNGLRNLRIAETEKYAHVTFFFNGGVEAEFPGEKRILVPSPKVATYDLKPEMSAPEVADEVVKAVGSGEFDVFIINFANADMVGHTGILKAAIDAIETLDTCVGRVVDAVRAKGGTVIITADHGNAEQMIDPGTREPFTAHTTGPVPFILIGDYHGKLASDGSLQDIAPTMLGLLGIPKPPQMTGHDLRLNGKGSR